LLSDHRLVSANLTTRCPKANVAYSWRKLSDVDTRQFEAELRQSELFFTPATATDAFTDQLTRVVTSQLDAIAPIRHSSPRPPKPISKWLSTEAVAAKRERRRLEHRWLSTRDERDRLKYRRACRSANKLITMSRRDYFKKRLLDCDTQSHSKRRRIVNELLHSRSTDKTRTDDENKQLCSTFADFFISKIVQLKSQISAKLASFSHIPPFPDPPTPNTGLPLNYLPPVTHAEVYKILTSVPPKSSSADLIPPSLIKSCPGVFSEIISVLANLSFSEGCFPTLFKKAVVTLLLKKPCLDNSAPSSYRPISNLNFISKILERLFLIRIQPHIFSSPNFNQHQSAYRRNYSTETALLSTTNSFFQSSDSTDTGKSTLLISLDLSAAFDTIDHSILSRLNTSFGLTGTVYSWLKSYLTDRYQTVQIGQHSSTPTLCTSGVPQGSVLGPLLFTIFRSLTSPIYTMFININILMIHSFSYLYPHSVFS